MWSGQNATTERDQQIFLAWRHRLSVSSTKDCLKLNYQTLERKNNQDSFWLAIVHLPFNISRKAHDNVHYARSSIVSCNFHIKTLLQMKTSSGRDFLFTAAILRKIFRALPGLPFASSQCGDSGSKLKVLVINFRQALLNVKLISLSVGGITRV